MIDIKLIREQTKFIEQSAKAKNITIDIARILELDKSVRSLSQDIERIATKKNETSKQIPGVSMAEREQLIAEMRTIDAKADEIKEKLSPLADELDTLLYQIPNPALPDVKVSQSDAENEIIKLEGNKPVFDFEPKDHLELGENLGIIDVSRAAKASGARFTYLKGDGARLQFALIQFALSALAKHGFIPVITPTMVSAKSMRAMGFLEHGGHEEIYYLPKDNMYFTGTSEQSLGPMHMDEILDVNKLPLRYVGYSTCYRREAGSYGKDTRGILRVHQFDKLEMFSFTKPEDSEKEHELILSIEENLMKQLGLHYRVVKMVSGDLGLPAARKYDIETWMPAQNTYRETHSCSTCTDFQARRLNTRYKENGKAEFVHTLNGTVFAMGRAIITILENYQQKDGHVIIPDVLRPFMDGQKQMKIDL